VAIAAANLRAAGDPVVDAEIMNVAAALTGDERVARVGAYQNV
jgi:hypothetical protein